MSHGHEVLVIKRPHGATDRAVVDAVAPGDLRDAEALAEKALKILTWNGLAPGPRTATMSS